MSSRTEILDRIIQKAQQDPDFRRALLSDPVAAVSEELGTQWPDEVSLRVIEESPQEVCIVLPPAPSTEGALSDEELASVAGGGNRLDCLDWRTRYL